MTTGIETAVGIAASVRSGDASPREMVERSLDRIARFDPDISAFAHLRLDEVRAEADALAHHPQLSELPLAGVPIAIKDSIDVIGTPTRQGSEATSADPVDHEPAPITRLRQAGALIVGKTTTPELCISAVTHSKLSGVTRNPWNLDRSPGGSSGGSAAAVASGMVPIALGTDGGGSVRLPAAACGLVGFKSARGTISGIDQDAGWYGVTQWGPLATSVDDAVLFYDVLAHSTMHDQLATGGPDSRLVRIGVYDDHPVGASADPIVASALAAALECLSDAGHDVSPAELPLRTLDVVRSLRRAGVGLARDVRNELDFWKLGPMAMALGGFGAAARLVGRPEIESLSAVADRMASAFEDFDIIVSPTMPVRPLPADLGYGGGLARLLFAQGSMTTFTAIWNLAGFPAISIPGPLGDDGLPTAAQLVALPGNELQLLATARELDAINPWQYPVPYSPTVGPAAPPSTVSRAEGADANEAVV